MHAIDPDNVHKTNIAWENLDFSWYSLLGVGIIVLITWLVLRVSKKLIKKSITGREVDLGRRNSVYLIVKYILLVVATVLCFETIGINSNIFITGSAALLFGFGLGVQNIFNDIVSGIIILFDGTLEIDDIVEVDGLVCQVTKINLRNSKVINREDKVMIVPNRKFVNENVVNWSHQNLVTRFSVGVGVHYKENEELVRAALIEAMNETPLIVNLKGYSPFVRFKEFGESSLMFEAIFWSREIFRIENVQSDLRFNIRRKFREHKIEIAYPQMDLHVKTEMNKISDLK